MTGTLSIVLLCSGWGSGGRSPVNDLISNFHPIPMVLIDDSPMSD